MALSRADIPHTKFLAALLQWWRKGAGCASAPDPPPLLAQADLLPRRMAALGLDADTSARIEAVTFRDLQRLCAACECQELCEWDLRQDPADPAWQDYCANSATLGALASLPSEWRAPWVLL
jgi:hypothetical protein